MPFIASSPDSYEGQVVATGACARFVQQVSTVGHTSTWRPGIQVKNNQDKILKYTVIANFKDGIYPNQSGWHAAIYVSQDATGILVWEQYVGQPVWQRTIRFKGEGKASNDGDAFYVVEHE